MFVNAILHHEVPVFDEKTAKFFLGDTGVIPHEDARSVVYVAVA
jgi:hypothetical protein